MASFSKTFLVHRKFWKVFLAVLSALAGLALAEYITRQFGFDWEALKGAFYYQGADRDCHQTDPDPELLYRLKPCSHKVDLENWKASVSVNAFGARGRQYEEKKPAGVFRIICLGGSNVYGTSVYGLTTDDSDTWPALLEAELNRSGKTKFEVWNFGTPAYVPLQMALLGREVVTRFDPDLVIFAMSNNGPRAFLIEKPVAPYFENNPDFWRQVYWDGCPSALNFLSKEKILYLARNSSLFRLLTAKLLIKGECYVKNPQQEKDNIKAARQFVKWAGEKTVVMFFLYPGVSDIYKEYYLGMRAPVFRLSGKNMPPEYAEIHPPLYVFHWYVENMVRWLNERRLVPAE